MPDGLNLAGTGQALDVSLPTVISQFKLRRDVTGVFRSCAEPNKLQPHSGISWIRNNYGRAVAYALDEAADMNQAQSLSDAATTITPAEVGAQIVIPGSTLRRVADASLESRVATMLNNAYSLKEDQDGAAQMSSWTASLGSTGVVLSVGSIFAAAARIGVGFSTANPEPAPLPHYYVGHDFQLLHLIGRMMQLTDVPVGTTLYTGLTATGATFGPGATGEGLREEVLRGGIGTLTTLSGITVKKDANIPVGSTPDARGGLFSGSGLLYVNEVEPKIVKDTSDVSMRDAVELNVWGSYKFGLYLPLHYGCGMFFDATTPTG